MDNRNWDPFRRSEEYQEEDVWNQWNVFKDEPRSSSSPLSISRRLPSAARMIPGTHRHDTHDSDGHRRVQQHSAPVSIPDWSKIYGKSPQWSGDSHHSNHYGYNYNVDVHGGAFDSDDNDLDDPRLAPHEWLARKQARSGTSSFSMGDGAGRSRKGKELFKKRDAVWSKTGFL